ncbi:hypothetical protein D9611_007256 [Ephemerocybe angulata]|uniref:Uncharacterized protein n=1 Tax=Ephemerocybe angulata TaxID=980116 RepID=A0A8H5B105_9AGAR|nr:hypothetical protein D9611_007256 [Tulosesus angulatus]
MVRIITTLSVATLSILAVSAQPIASFGDDPTDFALHSAGLGGLFGAISSTAGAVAKSGAKVAKSQVKGQAKPRNHSTGEKSHHRSRKARKAVNLQQKFQNQQQNGEQNTGQNHRREILELQDELEEMLARREMGEEAFDELVGRSAFGMLGKIFRPLISSAVKGGLKGGAKQTSKTVVRAHGKAQKVNDHMQQQKQKQQQKQQQQQQRQQQQRQQQLLRQQQQNKNKNQRKHKRDLLEITEMENILARFFDGEEELEMFERSVEGSLEELD